MRLVVYALFICLFAVLQPCFAGEKLLLENAVSVKQGYGHTKQDKSVDGNALTINGYKFKNGIGTHSVGEIVFNINGEWDRFCAYVGIDTESNGSAEFVVIGDGKELWKSQKLKSKMNAQKCEVTVKGVKTLKLVCTDGGDDTASDHADWAEPQLLKSGEKYTVKGPPPPVDPYAAELKRPPLMQKKYHGKGEKFTGSIKDVDKVTATCSSFTEDRTKAQNVLDGDSSTGWKPKGLGEEHVTLDFKREIYIHKFTILWGWGEWGADMWSIQISNDNKSWKTVSTATVEMCVKAEMGHTRGFNPSPSFSYSPALKTRYLRLLLQKPRRKRKNKEDLEGGEPYDSYLVSDIYINGGSMVASTPPPADALYRDPEADPAERVKDLVARMTFEEKLTLLDGYECFFYAGLPRFGLRAMSFADASMGINIRGESGYLDKSTCFPAATLMAATFDRALVGEVSKAIAEECLANGTDVLLGPGMNIHRTALCGRNFEYYSEDPYLSAQTAVAYIKGLQSQGIVATAKHLVANNFELTRNDVSPMISERALFEIYFPSFEAASKEANVGAIMTAYNWLNGKKCGEDPYIMNQVMRKKFGYKGMFMSDWYGNKDHGKVLDSGQNVIMPGNDNIYKDTMRRYEKDPGATEKAVDEMIAPPLRTFFAAGLYDRPRGRKDLVAKLPEHKALSQRAGAEGITVLKNNGILPLKKDSKILFTGDNDDLERFHNGRGSGEVKGWDQARYTDAYPEKFSNLKIKTYRGELAASDEEIKNAEAIIYAVARHDIEGEDSRFRLEHADKALKKLAALNKNVVVIIAAGAGIGMPWKDDVAAIVHTYYAGQDAELAIADVLSGDVNPSGKLPFTIGVNIKDEPGYGYNIIDGKRWGMRGDNHEGTADAVRKKYGKLDGWPSEYKEGVFVGYRWYDKYDKPINFPFGHGLSYTTFEIGEIKISSKTFTPGRKLVVAVTVTNTGQVPGAEVAQLYVQDVKASVERPVRELKGFEKVFLKPGESKVVKFVLNDRSFSFYDETTHDWKIEPGKFVVTIGNSSRNVQAKASITVK